MLVALVLSSVALAEPQPLIPSYEEGATRSVKVDIFSFAPGVHPYGTDWSESALEQWSAVLDCEMVGRRREACTFRSGEVWWGYVRKGTNAMTVHHIPMKGTFEMNWTPTGRLGAWDVTGDRASFHEVASNAMLALYHRQDVVWKPDAQRKIGADMEQSLLRGFAAALEVDLPKKGRTDDGAWTSNQPLWVGRRWSQGAATARIRYQTNTAGGATVVEASGRMSESPPVSGSTSYAVEASILGYWELGPDFRPVRTYVESAHFSTSTNLAGHTRFIGLAVPYVEGESTEPAAFPTPRIRE